MAISMESLGIDRLSVQDRLDLIEQIWNSLPEQLKPQEIPSWHVQELTRRQAKSHPSVESSKHWKELLADIKGKV